MDSTPSDRPKILIRPPVLYLSSLLIGIALNFLFPLKLFETSAKSIIFLSALSAGIGILMLTWAVRTFRQFGVDPRFKPVGNIVKAGPFAWSRNPMYIAFNLIYIGIVLASNNLWLIIILPLTIAILHYGVIFREEKYLEEKFGAEYQEYKSKVRRWL